MTTTRSPYQRVRSLELELSRRVGDAVAHEQLPTREADTLRNLMMLASSAIKNWEVADRQDERVIRGQLARTQLDQAENTMLRLSQYDIFSPVDVAEYSVTFGYIADALV